MGMNSRQLRYMLYKNCQPIFPQYALPCLTFVFSCIHVFDIFYSTNVRMFCFPTNFKCTYWFFLVTFFGGLKRVWNTFCPYHSIQSVRLSSSFLFSLVILVLGWDKREVWTYTRTDYIELTDCEWTSGFTQGK